MATEEQRWRVYEQIGVRGIEDGLIRPGGLALTQRALALSTLVRGSRVLDMGCGTGTTLRYLVEQGGFRAIGIDPSDILLAEGRRRNTGLPMIRSTGERLPFADAVMDGVLAECSLSVAQDVNGVIRECGRVLKTNGHFIVSDVYSRSPDGASDMRNLPMECCLTGAVSREEWISRLSASGFRVVFWEDHSVALKEFAARLIFSCGSMESFLCRPVGNSGKDNTREFQAVLSRAKPGYFLLIAQKL